MTRIYVRDPGLQRVAEIDDYQSLGITEVFNGVGSWTITLNPRTAAAKELNQPGAGIIVEDGELPTFSGLVTLRNPSYRDGSRSLTISGASDEQLLADRLAFPCHQVPDVALQYPAQSHDTRSGHGEAVLKGYVYAAMDQAVAWDPRQAIPNLVVAIDKGQGSTVVVQARFDNLRELLASTALAAGDLGFYLRQLDPSSSDLTFDVYIPRDQSLFARFSLALGNLSEYDYSEARPTENHIVVAGQGDFTDRAFWDAVDQDSVDEWGFITPALHDRRDAADLSILDQEAQTSLAAGKQKLAASFTALDTYRDDGTPNVVYGTTYGLGDIAAVEIDGVTITDVIRQVERSYSTDAPRFIKPLIGSPDAVNPKVLNLFSQQKRNAQRISQIERSQ